MVYAKDRISDRISPEYAYIDRKINMALTIIAVTLMVMVTVIIISIISDASTRKRRMEALKESFGKPPDEDRQCVLESISKYASHMKEKNDNPLGVDDITWNDLDMDKVFKRINVCLTSVGEEYLYNCLHELPLNSDRLKTRERLVQFFQENPEKRLAVQSCLAGVGTDNFNGLPFLLFYGNHKTIRFQMAIPLTEL